MPFGHTIAEFFGHLIFSFTRSVAEHYNFDEADDLSGIFGYNALDDTGKEWYCQPVDEVIYQEYSNSEATSIDYLRNNYVNPRLIEASSTERVTEETREAMKDREMAWKHLRPSILRTIWSSLWFGFLISVLGAAVAGLVAILVYYLSYETVLNCEIRAKDSIPIKLQWVITISEVFSISFLYYWFFLNALFYFRPFQITGLKLRMSLLCLAFYVLDSAYRIALQAFGISHSKLTTTQRLPAGLIYYVLLCLQVYILARHFCERPRIKLLKLTLLFMGPCVLTLATADLCAFLVYPAYEKQGKTGKLLYAMFAPLIPVLLKGVSRVCVQRIWCGISHPGTSFVLLVPLYSGSAVMLRLLQVDLQNLESVALIGVIHGIAEVIDRSTMVLIDHITNRLLERRTIPWGGFRTPRRERLTADISIMSMLYESSAIISVNGFLYLYQYFYTSDNSPLQLLQSFASTTSVPLAIEWFFTSVSIAIETRYQNMPVMAVWRKRWRRHILVAVIALAIFSIWASTRLFTVVQGRFTVKTKSHCEMPFSSAT